MYQLVKQYNIKVLIQTISFLVLCRVEKQCKTNYIIVQQFPELIDINDFPSKQQHFLPLLYNHAQHHDKKSHMQSNDNIFFS